MATRKPAPTAKRMIWRITEAAPLGEYVDANEVAAARAATARAATSAAVPPPPLPEATVSSGGWVVSSFELLHGADVTEGYDTVPGDLFDSFFAPSPPPAAAPDPDKKKPGKPG
ncbi:MAG TPA: hypothetical protein VIP10_11010 [Burkholderiaceae bacterium]